MSAYPIHTPETAPESSRPVLEALHGTFGIIPNIAGAMATSPALITGFLGLFQAVHGGRLSEAEIQVLLLTNAVTNASPWPVAFHSFLALQAGISPEEVAAIRVGRPPQDVKFAALSNLARTLIETRGYPDASVLDAFLEAGFDRERALEVIGAVAASALTNYTASLTEPPLEAFLEPHAWAPAV